MQHPPQYIIYADHEGEAGVMQCGPVDADDAAYFVDRVLPTLRPMSDDEYMHGPAIFLHTLARYSYILFGDNFYWNVEWDRGLIVIRFSPDGTFAWTAIRSPVPEFGRRTPNAEDLRLFDETAENRTYNLVFRAWDAQFDEENRRWKRFELAPVSVVARHAAALQHVNMLGEVLEAKYSGDAREEWAKVCNRNLADWAGEGLRLN